MPISLLGIGFRGITIPSRLYWPSHCHDESWLLSCIGESVRDSLLLILFFILYRRVATNKFFIPNANLPSSRHWPPWDYKPLAFLLSVARRIVAAQLYWWVRARICCCWFHCLFYIVAWQLIHSLFPMPISLVVDIGLRGITIPYCLYCPSLDES